MICTVCHTPLHTLHVNAALFYCSNCFHVQRSTSIGDQHSTYTEYGDTLHVNSSSEPDTPLFDKQYSEIFCDVFHTTVTPYTLIRTMKDNLKNNGTMYIKCPTSMSLDLFKLFDFTIKHFWCTNSLNRFCSTNGLLITNIHKVNQETVIYEIKKNVFYPVNVELIETLLAEINQELYTVHTYECFKLQCDMVKNQLCNFICYFRIMGYNIMFSDVPPELLSYMECEEMYIGTNNRYIELSPNPFESSFVFLNPFYVSLT